MQRYLDFCLPSFFFCFLGSTKTLGNFKFTVTNFPFLLSFSRPGCIIAIKGEGMILQEREKKRKYTFGGRRKKQIVRCQVTFNFDFLSTCFRQTPQPPLTLGSLFRCFSLLWSGPSICTSLTFFLSLTQDRLINDVRFILVSLSPCVRACAGRIDAAPIALCAR